MSPNQLSRQNTVVFRRLRAKRAYLKRCKDERYYRDLAEISMDESSFMAHLQAKAFSPATGKLISLSRESESHSNIYLSFAQTRNLMLAPSHYLTEKEVLILAVNICHHYKEAFEYEAKCEQKNYSGERKKRELLSKFTSNVSRSKDKDVLGQLTLFRALARFDFAINCRIYPEQEIIIQNKKKKEKRHALLEARSYFLILVKMRRFLDIAIPFVGMIESLLHRYAEAVRWLLQGTRLMIRPGLLFTLISQLYHKLGMDNVAVFYQMKGANCPTDESADVFLMLESILLEAA